MSHTALTYHIVLGTHKRLRAIEQENETFLYRFIYEFMKRRDIFVRRIGGMPDHVHILCDIPAKYSLADVVRTLKAESSKYARHSKYFKFWEGWASGYGAFTIGVGQREDCKQYIRSQKEHHTHKDFEEEYFELLRAAGISDSSVFGNDDIPKGSASPSAAFGRLI